MKAAFSVSSVVETGRRASICVTDANLVRQAYNVKSIAPALSTAAKAFAVVGAVVSVADVIISWAVANPSRTLAEQT